MAGGLGGLGGYLNSPSGGNMLQALGYSLMSSPRNAPLQNFGRFHAGLQEIQMQQDALAEKRADTLASREAMAAALVSAGVSPEEAATLSINPQAAELRLSQIQREREQAEYEGFLSRMPGYGGAAADTSGGSSGGLGGLGGSPVIDGNNIPEIVPTPARPQIAQDYGGANVFAEPGAAQMDANRFTPGGAIADPNFIEPTPAPGPGAEIPLAKPAGNKTVAWLQENDPEVATLVDQGVISPQDGFGIATQRMQGQRAFEQRAQASQAELDGLYQRRDAMARWLTEAPSEKAYNQGKRHLDIYDAQIARLEKQRDAAAGTDTMRNLQWRAEQAGLQPGTPEYQNFILSGGSGSQGGGDNTHGTPFYTQDADGNLHVNFASKAGDRLIRAEAAEGEKVLGPYDTSFQRASGTAGGKVQGEALANLPTDLATADQAVAELDALIEHPGLSSIAGSFDQYRPAFTMGAKGKDALARFNQARGRAFLQAFGMLKGGGQITEIEGVKAEQAMARMDRAQSEPEFKQALEDFRDAVKTGAQKLRERAGVTSTPEPTPEARSSGGTDYTTKYGLEKGE